MPPPLFTTSRVDELLAMPKRFDSDNWHRDANYQRHGTIGERRTIDGYCPDTPDIFFRILVDEPTSIARIPSCSVTLLVTDGVKPRHAICRYDVHAGKHRDPEGDVCGLLPIPMEVPPLMPHSHTYCPAAVQQDLKWDSCAIIVGDRPWSSTLLLQAFEADLNIGFDTKGLRGTLWSG